MRRQNNSTLHGKKLALNKESLKQLTPQDLAGVAGAGPTAIDCSITCRR